MFCLWLNAGCTHTRHGVAKKQPEVVSRIAPAAGNPIAVGLNVQCDPDPVRVFYGRRLAEVLATEIELAQPGTRVHPWEPEGQLGLPAPGFHFTDSAPMPDPSRVPKPPLADPFPDSTSDSSPAAAAPEAPVSPDATEQFPSGHDDPVIQISFQPPFPMTPPAGSGPMLEPLPPRYDRILQIRIAEFRPWFPMKAVLQLTVLNGETMDPMFATTADWAISDGRLCGGCQCVEVVDFTEPAFWKDDVDCQPSAAHNSPEALIDVMAKQVAAWFAGHSGMPSALPLPPAAVPQQIPVTAPPSVPPVPSADNGHLH